MGPRGALGPFWALWVPRAPREARFWALWGPRAPSGGAETEFSGSWIGIRGLGLDFGCLDWDFWVSGLGFGCLDWDLGVWIGIWVSGLGFWGLGLTVGCLDWDFGCLG